MATDAIYETCLPILKDESLEDEDKTEKLEELVREKTELTGKPLENAVLDVLWRFRNAAVPGSSSPTVRHTIVRRNSPAPWQASRSSTPLGMSPRSSAAVSPALSSSMRRPSLFRMKSSTAGVAGNAATVGVGGSPFGSPKPSPAMNYAHPRLPHSPSLNAYEFQETPPQQPASGEPYYGDYGSDNVEWLVSDDGASSFSTSNAGDFGGAAADPVAASDWVTPQLMEMGPYDILRSILRDDRSDEEIEEILEANGYDLGASIAALMGDAGADASQLSTGMPQQDKTYLVGKSMAPNSRPVTPAAGQGKSPVVCRYWLASGSCLRADCRFSHELTNHVCKYWMEGKCLAGDSCLFSHDPAMLVSNLSLTNQYLNMTPPGDAAQLNYSTQDYSAFPALGTPSSSQQRASPSAGDSSLRNYFSSSDKVAPPPGFSSRGALAPEFIPSRPQSRSRPPSRPSSSRHQSPAPKTSGVGSTLDDENEAFPSLGSAAAASKAPKKHHGKRGHGHGHNRDKDTAATLADVVRKSPAPPQSPRRSLRSRGGYSGSGGSNSAAAHAIPAPDRIPWLETGESANKAYLKARQDAIRHGSARNKFLQSAAQAWNRNDVRAAKALSLRGQSENDLMREAHREAARQLYDERNNHTNGKEEVFIDLHGLHPAEAVSYLSNALSNQRSRSALYPDPSPYLYAIIGTGHHSKNGRDKVGKAIRAYLNECRYAFREFSAPGDKGANGGILGIDASTGDVINSARAEGENVSATNTGITNLIGESDTSSSSSSLQHGKIRILKHNDAKEQGLAT